MDEPLVTRTGRTYWWPRLLQSAAVLVAAPFLVGAVVIAWQLAGLPNTAGRLMMAKLLEASMFSFGLSLGIAGSVLALTAFSPCRRILGAAMTLFGCSHIMLGFFVRQSIEEAAVSGEPFMLPIIVPIVLWAYSTWLAIRARGVEEPSLQARYLEQITEGQPQPLSRP
jgi:succinate dehydrogenase/fumarate reductase cytochrome b subunit